MARRKGWENLSPAYRARWERNGGRTAYESNKPTARVRGHHTPHHERQQQHKYRAPKRFPLADWHDYEIMIARYGSARDVDRLLAAQQEARSGGSPDRLSKMFVHQPIGAKRVWYFYH